MHRLAWRRSVSLFLAAFGSASMAILKVFLIIAAAGLLVRRGVLDQRAVSGLSDATVVLLLPCLIFSKVVDNLDPSAVRFWWALPIIGIAMAGAGLTVAALAFATELPAKRNMLPLASMQNAGYLVLPIGLALYPDRFDRFAVYCFLFILGFNAILWSVGKLLATEGGGARGLRGLLTPPLVANLAALSCALTGAGRLLPGPFLDGVRLVGQAAVPVAAVVLGGVLGGISPRLRPYLWDGTRVLAIKLGVLPLITVVVLRAAGIEAIDPLLARFLILEAASAPAVGIMLQVRTYGGDESKVGSLMLAAYAACAITLPLWLAVWEVLSRG
jgi:predicted permease